MDFSERKCSGDGLGTKNGSVISLKMVVNSILNLSVFSICCFAPLHLFVCFSRAVQTDKQTDRLRWPEEET